MVYFKHEFCSLHPGINIYPIRKGNNYSIGFVIYLGSFYFRIRYSKVRRHFFISTNMDL